MGVYICIHILDGISSPTFNSSRQNGYMNNWVKLIKFIKTNSGMGAGGAQCVGHGDGGRREGDSAERHSILEEFQLAGLAVPLRVMCVA